MATAVEKWIEKYSKTSGEARMLRRRIERGGGDIGDPFEAIADDYEEGSVSPAELFAPYYGKDFAGELLKAGAYAKREGGQRVYDPEFDPVTSRFTGNNLLNPGFRSFLFEDVPVVNDAGGVGPHYNTKKEAVSLFSRDAAQRDASLMNGEDEVLDDSSWPYRYNSFSRDRKERVMDRRTNLEHELGHHAYRPALGYYDDGVPGVFNRLGNSTMDKGDSWGGVTRHMFSRHEMVQGASRLQRELFKLRGKRITERKDFDSLLDAKSVPDGLSEEGQRFLRVARELRKVEGGKDKEKSKAAKEALDAAFKVLPALVRQENEEARQLLG